MTHRGTDAGGLHDAAPQDGHPPKGQTGADPDITLFGVVAHELRSPIAAILGYEELLTEGLLGTVDDRAREALEIGRAHV